jgi:hypothetical protein
MAEVVTDRTAYSYFSKTLSVVVATLPALPTAAVLGCAAALAWNEHGSIAAGSWLPYAILVALAGAVALTTGAVTAPHRRRLIGPLALLALAAWAAVTVLWAPVPSLARDEALLTLFYAVTLALVVATLTSWESRVGALSLLALSGGAYSVATALRLVLGPDPVSTFVDGRLSYPIDYANADAAIAVVALWPGIVLGARRGSPVAARALALAAAGAGLAGSLLSQSKGSVIGLVASCVVVFAVSSARLRLLVPFGVVAVVCGVAFMPLTEPFRAAGASPIRHAGLTVLAVCLACGAFGGVYAAIDRRLAISPRATSLAGRAVVAALAVAVAAGAAGFVLAVHHPERFASRQWAAFKHSPGKETDSTHLLSLGSNRYDFWRVALDEFAHHPLRGVGARGFGPDYLIHGRSYETPALAHSIVFEAMGTEGVVGLLLLVVGLGAPFLLAFRGALRRRAPVIGALGAATAVVVQACADWTWTFPAVALPALVALGLATAEEDWRPVARRARTVLVAAAAVVVALFAPVWLAQRFTDAGIRAKSQSDLDMARRLDPLTTAPLLAEVQIQPLPQAVEALRKAVAIEPRAVVDRYYLGVAYLSAGDHAGARAELLAALRLKPGDPAIRAALASARRG